MRLRPGVGVDLYHLFTRSRRELASRLPAAMASIRQNGMIWVSWPKKASGVTSDVAEDDVRRMPCPWAWSTSRSALSTTPGPA